MTRQRAGELIEAGFLWALLIALVILLFGAVTRAQEPQPPSHLRYGSKIYTIKQVNKPWEDDVLATTNCSANWIKVLMSNEIKRESVLHEMMHVATGCSNSEPLHESIYALAPGLLKLLQDNPAMVRYLMKQPASQPSQPSQPKGTTK